MGFYWSNGPRTPCVILIELFCPREVSITSVYILETGMTSIIFPMVQDQCLNENSCHVRDELRVPAFILPAYPNFGRPSFSTLGHTCRSCFLRRLGSSDKRPITSKHQSRFQIPSLAPLPPITLFRQHRCSERRELYYRRRVGSRARPTGCLSLREIVRSRRRDWKFP